MPSPRRTYGTVYLYDEQRKTLFISTRVQNNLIDNVLEYVSTEWPRDEAIANMLKPDGPELEDGT